MCAYMMNAERKQAILLLIRERGRATVAELSQHFGVSAATVRRDLDALEDEELILRTHGGAVVAERALPEPPIIQRMKENEEEKKRIGKAAAELIQDGETIFLGSGTTTFEVARNLTGKKNLTVITNAINIVNALVDQPHITVIVTGGLLRHSELSIIGHIAEQTLKELRANKVIMGMRAISVHDGLTSDYLPEIMTDRAIMRSAPEVILVADHSKLEKVSTVLVAPITAVHKIVTDAAAPASIVTELRRLGIEVILA